MCGSETAKGEKNMKKRLCGIAALLCMAVAVQSVSAVVLNQEENKPAGYRYDVTQCTKPEVGSAATRQETKLYSEPKSDAEVLMTYYPNVRVEVQETGDAFVRVRIGEEGSGCMEGYMPAENLAYGEEGVRAVLGRIVEYSSPNAVILYAERNTKSNIIQNGIDLMSASTLGYSDDWLHVRWRDAKGLVTVSGFVDGGQWEGVMRNDPMDYCLTEPMVSELSYEEAWKEAVRILIENGTQVNGKEETVTRENLERCKVVVECYYYASAAHPLQYQLSFISSDEMIHSGYSDYYAFINLEVEGKEVVGINFGNG